MHLASTVKFAAFCLRFHTEECVLRVIKSKITGENDFHGVLFEMEDNDESCKVETTWLQIFLRICYSCFNL